MKCTRRESLIRARKEKQLFQKDIVALLNSEFGIKITESYYGMIEQGVRTPNLKLAFAISKILAADTETIFFNNKNNKMLC